MQAWQLVIVPVYTTIACSIAVIASLRPHTPVIEVRELCLSYAPGLEACSECLDVHLIVVVAVVIKDVLQVRICRQIGRAHALIPGE